MLDALEKSIQRIHKAKELYQEYYTHIYENEQRQLVPHFSQEYRDDNGNYIQPRVMQHCSHIIHHVLGYPNFDFHSLRHTHATILLKNGANVKDVQVRLGHKNIQVTLQIYAHATEKMQNQTIEILNQIPVESSQTMAAKSICQPNIILTRFTGKESANPKKENFENPA